MKTCFFKVHPTHKTHTYLCAVEIHRNAYTIDFVFLNKITKIGEC